MKSIGVSYPRLERMKTIFTIETSQCAPGRQGRMSLWQRGSLRHGKAGEIF